jgi:predicted restriction endonuclease
MVRQRAHLAQDGPHSVNNGLLLRQDFHTLFDRGYLTVTPQYAVEVSRRIKEEFENGKEYYALHGRQISHPLSEDLRPSNEFLVWHNKNRFRG